VITVPGHFFDVDPGQRRGSRASRFVHHARFSFGPNLSTIDEAIKRLGKVVAEARSA
jgi:DNA-binding transcriptional MocR family regulator